MVKVRLNETYEIPSSSGQGVGLAFDVEMPFPPTVGLHIESRENEDGDTYTHEVGAVYYDLATGKYETSKRVFCGDPPAMEEEIEFLVSVGWKVVWDHRPNK